MINRECDLSYDVKRTKTKSDWEIGILLAKFKDEYENGVISKAPETHLYTHTAFIVPKDDGGGCMVVDCSKPHNCSVNRCPGSISEKFSYSGVDTVTDILEKGDFK